LQLIIEYLLNVQNFLLDAAKQHEVQDSETAREMNALRSELKTKVRLSRCTGELPLNFPGHCRTMPSRR
jgi:hypothetical protein